MARLLTKENLDKDSTMAKKSEKSKISRKAKATQVATKKNLQVRVRSLEDLQVTKDKKTRKEIEETGSDCEVIEMQASVKRKNSVDLADLAESDSASEPKMSKTDVTSLKSAKRPFVASQKRGRDSAATLSSVQVTFLHLHSEALYPC